MLVSIKRANCLQLPHLISDAQSPSYASQCLLSMRLYCRLHVLGLTATLVVPRLRLAKERLSFNVLYWKFYGTGIIWVDAFHVSRLRHWGGCSICYYSMANRRNIMRMLVPRNELDTHAELAHGTNGMNFTYQKLSDSTIKMPSWLCTVCQHP